MIRYVVVVMPDLTLNAEVIGPFNSKERAEQFAERIDKASEDFPMLDGGHHPSLTQVVPMVPGALVDAEYIEGMLT